MFGLLWRPDRRSADAFEQATPPVESDSRGFKAGMGDDRNSAARSRGGRFEAQIVGSERRRACPLSLQNFPETAFAKRRVRSFLAASRAHRQELGSPSLSFGYRAGAASAS